MANPQIILPSPDKKAIIRIPIIFQGDIGTNANNNRAAAPRRANLTIGFYPSFRDQPQDIGLTVCSLQQLGPGQGERRATAQIYREDDVYHGEAVLLRNTADYAVPTITILDGHPRGWQPPRALQEDKWWALCMRYILYMLLGLYMGCSLHGRLFGPPATMMATTNTTYNFRQQQAVDLDLSQPLQSSLENIPSALSSSVLDRHSIIIDQCGIMNLGPGLADEWGICWSPSAMTGEDEVYNANLGETRNTLVHVLMQRASNFCKLLDAHNIKKNKNKNHNANVDNETPCAKFWARVKEDKENQEGNDGSSLPSDIAWQYFKLGNFLARQQTGMAGRNWLTQDLDTSLKSLYDDLMATDQDGDADKTADESQAHQLSWSGSYRPAEANVLGQELLCYFGPPSDENNDDERTRRPLQGDEKKFASFDVKNKPNGMGLLPWRVRNTRRSVAEFCDDLETKILTPFLGQRETETVGFVTWAQGVVDALHMEEMKQDLAVIMGILSLPWREHCGRAVQGLDALEKQLINVGRLVQVSMYSGWALRVTMDQDHDMVLRRVLVPPRRYIAGYVDTARKRLRDAVHVTGKTGLGGWRGMVDMEEWVSKTSKGGKMGGEEEVEQGGRQKEL